MAWTSQKGHDRRPAELRPAFFPSDTVPTGIEPEPTYLVVGDFLRRASPFFNRVLAESQDKSDLGAGSLRRVEVHGFDEAALFIVLRTFNRGVVPRECPPMIISKIAAVVEHFECAELMTPLYDFWREQLHPWILWEPGCVTSTLMALLYSSLVFKDHLYFCEAVAAAIQYAYGLLPTLGLPIPWGLIRTSFPPPSDLTITNHMSRGHRR